MFTTGSQNFATFQQRLTAIKGKYRVLQRLDFQLLLGQVQRLIEIWMVARVALHQIQGPKVMVSQCGRVSLHFSRRRMVGIVAHHLKVEARRRGSRHARVSLHYSQKENLMFTKHRTRLWKQTVSKGLFQVLCLITMGLSAARHQRLAKYL